MKRGVGFWIGLAVSALVGSLLVMRFTGKAPSPVLTEAALGEARAHWAAAGIRGYTMTIVVSGKEPAVHVVEAVADKPARLTTDGRAQPERLAAYWTVEGMFRTLEEDLVHLRSPSAAFGVSDPRDVYLDAAFDSSTGVPKRYLRQVKGRTMAVEWEVREFRRL